MYCSCYFANNLFDGQVLTFTNNCIPNYKRLASKNVLSVHEIWLLGFSYSSPFSLLDFNYPTTYVVQNAVSDNTDCSLQLDAWRLLEVIDSRVWALPGIPDYRRSGEAAGPSGVGWWLAQIAGNSAPLGYRLYRIDICKLASPCLHEGRRAYATARRPRQTLSLIACGGRGLCVDVTGQRPVDAASNGRPRL